MTRKWRAGNYRRVVAPMATVAALAGLSWSPAVHAIPNLLTVQGVLTNEAGTAVDGTYDLKFSLYTAQTGGTLLWDETETGIVVTDGIFDDVLGDVDPVSDPLRVDYFRNNAEVWLQIELEAGPGVAVNEAPLPRQLMTSSAFAFAAHHATTATTATSASTATTATTATTAATATTAQGLTCAGACVSITELDFDPATQAELNAAVANMVTTASLNTTLGGYVTTGALNTALQSYATVTSLAGYATVGALSAYATTASVNTAISTALQPYSTTAQTTTAINTALAPYSTTAATTTAISTALQPYSTTAATTTAINTALAPYSTTAATTTAISTALQPYSTTAATTTAINTALQPYSTTAATTTAINTALQPYSTTAATATAISTALQPYSTTAATNTATTTAINTALQSYSTTAATTTAINTALQPYSTTAATTTAISTALQPYSTTAATTAAINTALTPYATSTAVTTAIAAALTPYSTTSAMNSAIATALSGYVTSTQLTTLLADYALKTELPTSISDLSGGTVEGNVAATGTVEGAVVKQNGNVVCDVSGNCGQTLADLDCDTNQIARFNGTTWSCYTPDFAGGLLPDAPCNGPGEALQWDGIEFRCAPIGAVGLSAGRANGYEISDDWGFGWDGIARGAKNWTTARNACAAVGGRLPTPTELFRNNATTGTGNVADSNATQYLWTIVQTYSTTLGGTARYVTTRLSDGTTAVADATATAQFRCVWPDSTSNAFAGDNCHGTPDASCQEYGLAWNVDTADRAKLDWTAAQNECAFYNASLLPSDDIGVLIRQGWAPTTANQYLWSSDVWHSGTGIYAQLYRWVTNPDLDWTMDAISAGTNSSWDQPLAATYSFRCVGKRDTSIGVLPTVTCYNNAACFTPTQRGSRILADNNNRPAATVAVAEETCRAAGGFLPTVTEFQDLVRSGWADSANVNLWMGEVTDPASSTTVGWGNIVGKWSGVGNGTKWWVGTASSNVLNTSSNAYRCVYRETLGATFPACTPTQVLSWNATTKAYECLASTNGEAGTSGFPNGNSTNDAWGNEWDQTARPAATYADATTQCTTVGARLPTATEIYRVSQNSGASNVLGAEFALFSGAQVHWTLNPVPAAAASRVTITTSTGLATTTAETATAQYRCIWPTTPTSAFTGRACHGNPTTPSGNDPCYSTNRLRTDDFDRPKLQHASAAWECNYYGGRLPSAEQWQHIIRSGATGSNAFVWGADYTYNAQSTSFGAYTAQFWNGVGTAAYIWPGSTAVGSGARAVTELNNFRCVFTDVLTR